MAHCFQINLQENLGGGEIYTRFFSEALLGLGWTTTLFVSRRSPHWKELNLSGVRVIAVSSETEILSVLPAERSLIITHTPASVEWAREIHKNHVLAGIAHMPLYERDLRGFPCYARIFAVSRHVLDSAHSKGLANLYPEPLYGVADLLPRSLQSSGKYIRSNSPYSWDKRKLRDRVLGALAPFTATCRNSVLFVRSPGLTLGIVSRLTPIKQFPLMFSLLAPVLARHPEVRIEIFGSGGYASVRDLKRALRSVRSQVRFWGQQPDVAGIYPQLDYVLSGLPEKEALGLNLIEAQVSGTPVLAVRAPPFAETVLDGVTGFLYEDPRNDQGADFERLLERLRDGSLRPDPRRATAHLARFSMDTFSARVERALASVS